MVKNIFLDYLRTMQDKSERQRLLQFVQSPYFNQSQKIDLQVKLIQLAWAWWDHGNAEYWDEKTIYTKVFGAQEKFSQVKFNKFKTAIVSLLTSFFAQETYQKNRHPVEPIRWEMEYYRRKALYHYHELAEKTARKLLKKQALKLSEEDMLQEYLLESEIAWLYPSENHRKEETYLTNGISALDKYWFTSRARWTSIANSIQQQVSSSEIAKQYHVFKEIEKILTDTPAVQNELASLYLASDRLEGHSNNPEILLDEFLSQIEKNSNRISPISRDELDALAANYCVKQINQNRFQFLPILFDIQQKRLNSKRIYRNGKILATTYHSIATIALRLLGQGVNAEWVKQFLDNHRNKLYNKEAAEEMIRYNYANYYFHIGDYKNALKNLKETYFDLNFKMTSKLLEIKTLYEIKDEDVLKRVDAAAAFFRRERKIPAPKKKLLIRFTTFVNHLLVLQYERDASKIKRLIEDVQSEATAQQPWLLEKAHELL